MRKLLYPIFAAVIFIACKQNEEAKPYVKTITAPSTQSIQDNNSIEEEFDDIANIVTTALESNNLGASNRSILRSNTTETCYSGNLNTTNKILTLTFDSSKTCLDSKIRSGKIIISYTDRYVNQGSVITSTLSNYKVNGNKIEGTRVIKNQGKTDKGEIKFFITVSNAKLTKKNGDVVTWTSERTRLWIAGQETPINNLDDAYKIYGTANGTDSKGKKFIISVAEATPLELNIECWIQKRLPVSGVYSIIPEGEDERKVDYGTGNCDNSFILIYKGYSFPITVTN